MGGLRRQSCRIERWRGYVATSFFVCFPDGTRIESAQFRWRRAELPPDVDAARAAYDELVERVAGLGWERHADGEPWFATEFIRFVEEPLEIEPLEHEAFVPPLPVQVAPERGEPEPVGPLPSVQVAPEPLERESVRAAASAQVAPEPVESGPAAPLPVAQVAPEPVEPAPAPPLPSVRVPPEPRRQEPVSPMPSVHVAPPAVQERVAPPPSPPVAQPPRARPQLAALTLLLVASARRLAARTRPLLASARRLLVALTLLLLVLARRLAVLTPPLLAFARRQLVALILLLLASARRLAVLTPPLLAFARRQLVALILLLRTSARRLAALTLLLRSARRRPAAPTALRRASARSPGPTLPTPHAPRLHRLRLPRVIDLFAVAAVIGVAVVVWGAAIHTLTSPKPVPVHGQPDAVVWGNRVFANRADFAHWLTSRGLSYRVWAKKHPDGVRIITGRPAPAHRAAPRAHRAPSRSREASRVARPALSSGGAHRTLAGYVLAGLLIGSVTFGLAFRVIA
jgi:hypothetical protein